MSGGIGIIGCGLIGRKRANALGGRRLAACADLDRSLAAALAASASDCLATDDWREVVNHDDVAAVIIATPHHMLAEICAGAIDAGCHVLVEKPAARNADELRPLLRLVEEKKVLVRVGFNHRYHRAVQKMREIIDSGALGSLMFLRARYGHGGRVGYDREWRAQPSLSGGGELIDQGVHLIDLARWCLGDFVSIEGIAQTCYWDMPVDDNAFLMLRTAKEQTAFLHASCTEWKNIFSWELSGKNGKVQIDGLGGSYGVERLTWYRMLPQMGPPETTAWEFPMADNSWEVEMNEFFQDIENSRQPVPGLADALAVLDIVDKIYERSGYDHRT
ncbi:MAG: Gfo/Idh/MocA family oxidoreductase [Pseudomonadales bacterium]|nr:Gfo/Idh/MocA family oxidoreductase [Pseudomonadales bacterium]